MTLPKHIFITSLAITLVVFFAGLLLGWYMDSYRTTDVLNDLRSNELDTESYLVEQAFWDSYGGEDCSFADDRLNSISVQLAELGFYLSSYQKKNIFEEDEFQYLARRYFLIEIKGYILYNELKETCDIDNDVILYFYGPDDPDSEKQGYVLDQVVDKSNGTVDIFSINKNFAGDQAIETLKLYYNITVTPTVIINGNITREGYVSYSEIQEILDQGSS
ncbi:hypothetical protein EXS74_00745 [Candidatus Woesearchaeota archaeon]|nr:hypothetical protein [Candidatus Woesearchaeota archaeon]